MSNFVHLERVQGSDLDLAKKVVVVKETNNFLGQGGRICDVKLSSGKILRGCSLGIAKDTETHEEEVFIDSIKFSDSTLLISPNETLGKGNTSSHLKAISKFVS